MYDILGLFLRISYFDKLELVWTPPTVLSWLNVCVVNWDNVCHTHALLKYIHTQSGQFNEDMIPTVGFNMRKVTKGNVTIKVSVKVFNTQYMVECDENNFLVPKLPYACTLSIFFSLLLICIYDYDVDCFWYTWACRFTWVLKMHVIGSMYLNRHLHMYMYPGVSTLYSSSQNYMYLGHVYIYMYLGIDTCWRVEFWYFSVVLADMKWWKFLFLTTSLVRNWFCQCWLNALVLLRAVKLSHGISIYSCTHWDMRSC